MSPKDGLGSGARSRGWPPRDRESREARTDRSGKSLPLFEGGTGHGTPDEARADGPGKR